MLLQGEWEKVVILSLMYESMGHSERNIWSQEGMSEFGKRLLLGSWTEREFRKRIQVIYNTFRFLCERLGPYLKEEENRLRETIPVQEIITNVII